MNLKDRAILLTKLTDDRELQCATMRLATLNPVWFINTFVFTFDPRRKPAVIPFELYPFQEELIGSLKEAWEKKEHRLIVKSRDMGLSWTVCSFFLWAILFNRDFAGTIGSRKEDEVDDKTIFSLMPKIDFALDRLPDFMRGAYDEKLNRSYMKIYIPETNSIIRGEGGDNIGRGGRSSVMFVDEFAFIPRSSRVMEAISQNSDCIVLGSTPCGRGNEFARIYHERNIKSHVYKWSQHPTKTEEWYAKQALIMSEEQIAQELDCSFAKSQQGRVYPQFGYETHCRPSLYDPQLPIETSWDFGIGDPTAITFWQKLPTEAHLIDYIELQDTSADTLYAAIKAKGYIIERVAYGDPDGMKRDRISGHSMFQYLHTKYDMTFRTKRELVRNGVMAVRNMLEKKALVVDSKLRHVVDCFENYRFPEKETGDNDKPVHDWTSHIMDSVRYYVDYNYPLSIARKISTQGIR
jgi:hypothetical protein